MQKQGLDYAALRMKFDEEMAKLTHEDIKHWLDNYEVKYGRKITEEARSVFSLEQIFKYIDEYNLVVRKLPDYIDVEVNDGKDTLEKDERFETIDGKKIKIKRLKSKYSGYYMATQANHYFADVMFSYKDPNIFPAKTLEAAVINCIKYIDKP